MDKLIKFTKLTVRGTPVGLLSGATDVGTMFALGEFTKVGLDYRVYISSALGMIVSFIGNYLWTFRHSSNQASNAKKLTKFMINHIILTIIHARLTIYVINEINKSVKRSTVNVFTTKDKDGKITITHTTEVVIKQFLAGFFYVMNIFIMQYIF